MCSSTRWLESRERERMKQRLTSPRYCAKRPYTCEAGTLACNKTHVNVSECVRIEVKRSWIIDTSDLVQKTRDDGQLTRRDETFCGKDRKTQAVFRGCTSIYNNNGIFLRGWLPHRGKAQMACNYCVPTRTMF